MKQFNNIEITLNSHYPHRPIKCKPITIDKTKINKGPILFYSSHSSTIPFACQRKAFQKKRFTFYAYCLEKNKNEQTKKTQPNFSDHWVTHRKYFKLHQGQPQSQSIIYTLRIIGYHYSKIYIFFELLKAHVLIFSPTIFEEMKNNTIRLLLLFHPVS